MNDLRKYLRNYDHRWMTFAAVEALSEKEKRFLEPELELLVTQYCSFPDANSSLYGEWGGWTGYPDIEGRYPDTRRAWNISYYMNCDPVTETGTKYYHCSPSIYSAGRAYFILKNPSHLSAKAVIETA